MTFKNLRKSCYNFSDNSVKAAIQTLFDKGWFDNLDKQDEAQQEYQFFIERQTGQVSK